MRLSLLAFSSALALLAAPGSALAQDVKQHSGLYLGGSVGQATMDYSETAVPFPNATQTSLSKDDKNAAFKLFAGYRINDYFALEGGYSNYGTFSATRNDVAGGSIRADTKVSGGHLDGLIIYPMDRVSLFARVGVMLSNTKTIYSGSNGATPADTDATKRELNARYGVGVGFEFNKWLGTRIEYERVLGPGNDRTGEADISMYSVGLILKF